MAPLDVDSDIEAQTQSNSDTEILHARIATPPTTNTAIPQPPTTADDVINVNNEHNDLAVPPQTTQVPQDENHGDSSDGLWSIYLNEAEKQDAEVTESWKGDTDGILVFTGLFSVTVASFIIESYHNLSPHSGDTTNALLAQISQQLVNISHGTPLTSIAEQSSQPFKPTASAVRVNVYWFLSLILSLTCALSATLMQQWARRYRELAQRRGAFHRRGRMRAYIFNGVNRFGMARAVATMPTLLHISVVLFFAGLAEFLFPVYATVAYVTLGCIMVFTLAYAILTVLPNIYLNCPYATPLSGFTWRMFQLSILASLWTFLKIEGLFRESMSKLRSRTNRHAPKPDGLNGWRETLKRQVEIRRQWFSQGMRKSVEFIAYRAESSVVTNALQWTLTALDEDKEIEDFAARMPGFFDSRVVPDATSAVLSLMSHQPNTDPIFGSRLHDLLKTCIPGMSLLDEKVRTHRLYVCVKCLWYFGRAYNRPDVSLPLPSYFPSSLIPAITRYVQTEEDSGFRVIGRCFGALIVNKLAADISSRNVPVSKDELTCISTILGTKSDDVTLLLSYPGAIEVTNILFLAWAQIGPSVSGKVPWDVPDVVQETFGILFQALPAELNATMRLNQLDNISDGTSPFTAEMYRDALLGWMKNLWDFTRERVERKNSMLLPSYVWITFSNPEVTRRIRETHDPTIRMIGRCVEALVVNKLAADIDSRNVLFNNDELACLSTILGAKSHDVELLLSQPGTVALMNMISLTFDGVGGSVTEPVPSAVPTVLQQTLGILSQAVSSDENSEAQLDQSITIIDGSDGIFECVLVSRLLGLLNTSMQVTTPLTQLARTRCLRLCLKGLWYFGRELNQLGSSVPLPSYIPIAFCNPEVTRRMLEQPDHDIKVIRRCVGALVLNKLAADINSRNAPIVNDDSELACLSTILGTKTEDVMLLLNHPGAIAFTNLVFLALDDSYHFFAAMPSDVPDVVQQTFDVLRGTLPAELSAAMRLSWRDNVVNISNGTSPLTAATDMVALRGWMKALWNFTRGYIERGNLVPLPSYVWVPFANPEMTRRIREERDNALHMIGRCVEALIVNKLVSDINSRSAPMSDDELACLSSILGTKSDHVMLLLLHPGAIEITNIIFLAWAHTDHYDHYEVLSGVPDVVQETFSLLFRALPTELSATMSRNWTDSLAFVPNGSSTLATEMPVYTGAALRLWMKNLWDFIRTYNNPGNLESFPSYVWITFINTEMIRRMCEECDIAVIGRCVEALIVSKLAADVNSRNVPVNNDELACLSAILGIKSDDVALLLLHPGAIEFTNSVFLTWAHQDHCDYSRMPSDILDVVQETFDILCQALPAELDVAMPPKQTDILTNGSASGTPPASPLTAQNYRDTLRRWMKNVWNFTRECIELGNSVPLPSYVWISFSNPKMTRCMREQGDLFIQVIGRCVGALVVHKLVADTNSYNDPVSNDQLACLSVILGTQSDDVRLCLDQPGTIELVNLASLGLGDISSSQADQMPPDLRSVFQQTLAILSQALPAQGNTELPPDHTVALDNFSDNYFERILISRLDGLLRMCIPAASSLMENVRTSCLRICLESLWKCGITYHQTPDPLPSYFPLVLIRPEVTRCLQTERDPISRIIGCCFCALIVNKLVDTLESPISFSDRRVSDAELACISAILGTEHRDVLLSPYQIRLINFRNVVSLVYSEIDTLFTSAGMPVVGVLKIAQDTLYILATHIPGSVLLLRSLPDVRPDVNIQSSQSFDRLKNETVITLDRLRQMLEQLLPGVVTN